MILILLAALLTLGVLAALLIPLMRPHAPPAPADRFNAAVYRQQLDELEADIGRDVLPGGEAAGARLEIERRLLNATRRSGGDVGAPRRAPVWVAAAIALLLVVGAGGLYLVVGRPGLPDQPFTGERSLAAAQPSPAQATGSAPNGAAPDAERAQFEALIAQLETRMVQNPGDAKGWLLLARGLMRLDRASEASAAYARVLALPGGRDPAILSEAAEARVLAAGGKVDAQSIKDFKAVAAADPKAPQPRYYLALAKAQAGDAAGALADWLALAADSPPGAPYLPALNARIAEAEHPSAAPPGPTGEEAAEVGALPQAQQQAMIVGMVDRLATRLKAQPDDIDGWRRLAHAQTVLGRAREADQAWSQVLRLEPGAADAKAALHR